MKSLAQISRKTLTTAAVIAISCGVTYYADEQRNEWKIATLESQVDSLSNKMLQARVTERISVQMSEIAAQQSEISEKERNRAEEQRKMAETERRKAEQERGRAVIAKQEALASAERARQAQEIAERESKRATENMLLAREAKAKSDTLYHLSLANSLAQSSIVQFNNDSLDLARLLALSSMKYYEDYGGNPATQQNIYESLLNTSRTSQGSITSIDGNNLAIKGNVRKIHVTDNCDVTGITDYGDVFYISNGTAVTDNIDKNNFRDFFTYGKECNLALCSDGRIIEYSFSNITRLSTGKEVNYTTRLQLPAGFWKRLIGINHGQTIVAMSDNMIAWIDGKTMTLTATAETQSTTTCIGKEGSTLHVFCERGVQYISSEVGQLQPFNFADTSNDKVTAYIYNKEKGLHFLGFNSGKIFVYNNEREKLNVLLGHDGPISDLHTWENILGSTSYDRSIRLWNIDNVSAQIPSSVKAYTKWILTFDVDKDSKTVWLGTEDGEIPRFCFDIKLNAFYTRNQLTREFYPSEWDYYVGKGDEQIYFKK